MPRRPRVGLGFVVVVLASTFLVTGSAGGQEAPVQIFPSDELTVPDPAQATGRRLNLPLPDCTVFISECNEVRLLNQLDGFDLEPRITLRFSGPIDVSRVTADTAYVEPVAGGPRIALNRLVWDASTNTVSGHPSRQLVESSTYRIVVTSAINGQSGSSTFTTLTATDGLVKMRRQLDDGSAYSAAGISPADRGVRFVRPDGARTVYPAANVTAIRRRSEVNVGRPLVEMTVTNTSALNAGLYAFGSILSPSWLTGDRIIPQHPTLTGQPSVTGFEEVGVSLIVPAGPVPAGGWPVAIYGHGFGSNRFAMFTAADLNAQHGIATIAIDVVGHNFGPRSEVAVTLAAPPSTVTFPSFGRGRDLDLDGTIGATEGVGPLGQPNPLAIIGSRDGLRQTAADNMALLRAVARGVDVDGDGTIDLRQTGISYYGISFGGIYGTMAVGADAQMQVAALNVPGGPTVDISRLSPVFRPALATELLNRTPPLLNGGPNGFTDSYPLYLDPPVTDPVPGAIPIQEFFSRSRWLGRLGTPDAFAPLLRERPLPDSPPKSFIFQFAAGDQTVPNPTSANIVRAGSFPDRVSFYRNDKTPFAGSNPHAFLQSHDRPATLEAQQQIVTFFASGGATVIDPDAAGDVWEVPIADLAALERLNFTPPAAAPPPRVVREDFHAEGSTRVDDQGALQTYLTMQNPHATAPSHTRVTYRFPTGAPLQTVQTVGPHSRSTIDVNAAVASRFPDGTDVSVQVETLRGPAVLSERPVYLDRSVGAAGDVNGGAVGGSGVPSRTWRFAEGSTRVDEQGAIQTYLTLVNPSTLGPSAVTIAYSFEGGGSHSQQVVVGPESRLTVDVNEVVGANRDVGMALEVTDGPGIVAERPMYFRRSIGAAGQVAGGSAAAAVTETATSWYLAEGSTRADALGAIQTYVAVVNPSGTPTSGTLSYQFSDGAPPSSRPFSLGATSRLTIDVNAEVGPGRDVSVSVLVDAGQPGVIAERPTYFSRSIAAAGPVDEGAAAVGVTAPRARWAFPEGTTRGGFQTYVSLQNPLTATAEVSVDFQRDDGTTTSQSLTVAPGTRVTVDVNAANPGEVDVSSLVRSTNGAPVVAERPMYFRRAIGVAGDVDGGSVAAGIPTG